MGAHGIYRLSRLLPILLIVGYSSVMVHAKQPNGLETFPFFSWSLFTATYSVRANSRILLRSVNGQPVDPPRLYYDMPETFAYARERDSRMAKVTRQLHRGISTGQEQFAETMKNLIDRRFMAEVGSAEYDLVYLVYDPLERRRTGDVLSMEVIGSFEKLPDE